MTLESLICTQALGVCTVPAALATENGKAKPISNPLPPMVEVFRKERREV